MALTQRLEFRQSQSLVMTPQLMQAIKLLQLSNLDLTTFVEEELERNPLLERANDEPPAGEAPAETGQFSDSDGGHNDEPGGGPGNWHYFPFILWGRRGWGLPRKILQQIRTVRAGKHGIWWFWMGQVSLQRLG